MCTRKGTEGSNPSLSASLRQAYGWQASRQPTTTVAGHGRFGQNLGRRLRAIGWAKAGMTLSIGASLVPSRVTLLGLLWGVPVDACRGPVTGSAHRTPHSIQEKRCGHSCLAGGVTDLGVRSGGWLGLGMPRSVAPQQVTGYVQHSRCDQNGKKTGYLPIHSRRFVDQTNTNEGKDPSGKFPSPARRKTHHDQNKPDEAHLGNRRLRKGIRHPFSNCDDHDYHDEQRADNSRDPTTHGCGEAGCFHKCMFWSNGERLLAGGGSGDGLTIGAAAPPRSFRQVLCCAAVPSRPPPARVYTLSHASPCRASELCAYRLSRLQG